MAADDLATSKDPVIYAYFDLSAKSINCVCRIKAWIRVVLQCLDWDHMISQVSIFS